MSTDQPKQQAAEAALAFVEAGSVIGIGTGSTVNYFIDALARSNIKIEGAVSSSEATTRCLKAVGIRVLELNTAGNLPLYVDGADEANRLLQLIKGGGGALTREKIIAAASQRFVCIADRAKLVDRLGEFPLPIEVIPMARSFVARQLVKLGGQPELRADFTTDNGNQILDVRNLPLQEPIKLETELSLIPGVVTVGLFARRGADVLLLGDSTGVQDIRP